MRTPNKKAVSTLILIILMLCSAVLGAFISYLLVMSTYYNMPENTTLLIVEDVVFPIFDPRYFNVTILNPSNSASDVNITVIRLTVEGKNEIHNITKTKPEPLPFLIRRGTRLTFKCEENWSNFAGETVRIEPVAENASTKSYLYTTPKVKLILKPNFEDFESVEYFNLTLENSAQSIVNLTISEIKLFGISINENVTPALPYVLSSSQRQTFQCNWNWESLRGQNVTITVKTDEGYEAIYTTSKLLGVALYIPEVRFDYADVTYFNLTISSSEDSTATATIDRINLTMQDGTPVNINETFPPIEIQSIFNSVPPNQSRTFKCFWNWSEHRNETIAINVYTLEGFTIPSKTTRTPPTVVWNVTDVKFDLDHMDYFLLNVTNMPSSLRRINVTKIEFNQNSTVMNSSIIDIGKQATFSCEYNWTSFVGKNVTITVHITYNENESSILYNLTLPYFKIRGVSFSNFSLGNPYVNITIYVSEFSTINATITQIFIETENGTRLIDGTITNPKISPDGYELVRGTEITIVCPWDWSLYLGENVTVIVQNAEGFQVSKTVQVE